MVSLKDENTAAARSEIAMSIEVKVKGIIKGDILRSKSGLRKVGPESIRCIERNIIRKIEAMIRRNANFSTTPMSEYT